MAEAKNVTELPLDVLLLIFPYLDAKSFLAFCATCKALQQVRLDPAYWSFQTRSTFRVPNQPVVEHDGVRWYKLYKRLLTETRVYTWGQTRNGRLGHRTRERSIPFPQEMEGARGLGIIADLQCGGWSTTILDSKGVLYTVGVLDGERQWDSSPDTTALQFPATLPDPATSRYFEPTVTIRQFSAGRSHILGLSDSGRIWSWHDTKQPAVQIKFVNIELKEDSSDGSKLMSRSLYGTVKQVIAGWSYSSAYVRGVGIVLWEPIRSRVDLDRGRRARSVPRRPLPQEDEPDTMLLLENFELPKTRYQRPKGAARESDLDRALGEEVGEVKNHIVLENFVVFVTDIGKVFCSKLDEKDNADNILELHAFRDHSKTPLDVQGSFRNFAMFKNGEVIIAGQGYLETCWNNRTSNPEQSGVAGLKRIPSLQHNNVVSIAFGDYHFLALHSTGKITSYGKELFSIGSSSGALGMGAMVISPLRGLRPIPSGLEFVPHAATHGREVWFRQEQIEWLNSLNDRAAQQGNEAHDRFGMLFHDQDVMGEVSEWIEQESKAWDEDKGEDGLGAYFALRVSAAGWHSGAVLLVNEELANKSSTYDWRNKTLPRLRLSDGREMPGSVPFDEWREGRPEWQFDWEQS